MKSKMIAGVSIAIALGATVTGGTLLAKPSISNKTVYMGATNKIKNNDTISKPNNQEVNVIMYVFKSKALKEYNECPGYGSLANQHEGFKEFSEGNPLGKATIKNYKGNDTSINPTALNNMSNASERLFPPNYMNDFKKVQVKIPVGTKLNVLWESGNTVGIEYKGNLAMISKNYLNTTGIPLTTKEILKTFAKGNNEKYIGTAIAQEDPTGAYPAITFHPQIEILLNGICYSYPLKPGSKVNIIKEGKQNQEVNTPIIGANGQIVNYKVETFPSYEKVEYNGIVGYMRPETLKTMKYN